ncbi:MAG: type II toxin-antitoxin system RelE/ParE family toxin [Rhodospirillales bacterium]|nr:type II toxin-antitoxin system RelE/ParE family toxin [Rhodospirillales bacterium]
MADLFVSRQAEADLREIWRYIASDNPAAADRVLLHIDAKLQIAPLPGEDEIDLVAVVDGRRQLSGLF